MVRDRLALSVDGSGAAIASDMAMFDEDELGGGLHESRCFLHFLLNLWANNLRVGQGDSHT